MPGENASGITKVTFCYKWGGGKKREIIYQIPLKPVFVEIHSQGYNVWVNDNPKKTAEVIQSHLLISVQLFLNHLKKKNTPFPQ